MLDEEGQTGCDQIARDVARSGGTNSLYEPRQQVASHICCSATVRMVQLPHALFEHTLNKELTKKLTPPSKKHLGSRLRASKSFPTTKEVLEELFSATETGMPVEDVTAGVLRMADGTLKPFKISPCVAKYKFKLQDPSHIRSLLRMEKRRPRCGYGAARLIIHEESHGPYRRNGCYGSGSDDHHGQDSQRQVGRVLTGADDQARRIKQIESERKSAVSKNLRLQLEIESLSQEKKVAIEEKLQLSSEKSQLLSDLGKTSRALAVSERHRHSLEKTLSDLRKNDKDRNDAKKRAQPPTYVGC
ncbi:hypothetical protein AB1Y20_012817 [Prymnesium parvum]|uniref:Uncharacterized protein n=1 Tax=Prymnesium parvum TaxID=97485 RepID=A0AB34ILV5_PRYPA